MLIWHNTGMGTPLMQPAIDAANGQCWHVHAGPNSDHFVFTEEDEARKKQMEMAHHIRRYPIKPAAYLLHCTGIRGRIISERDGRNLLVMFGDVLESRVQCYHQNDRPRSKYSPRPAPTE